MYSRITNPKTGRSVSVRSRLGKRILRNYLFVLSGGAAAEAAAAEAAAALEERRNRDQHSSARTEALSIMAQGVETSIGLRLAARYIPAEEEPYSESLHRAFTNADNINPTMGDILKAWLKEVFRRQITNAPLQDNWWYHTYADVPTTADIINIHCTITMNIIRTILVVRPDLQRSQFQLLGITIAAMVLPEGFLTDERAAYLCPGSTTDEVVAMKASILPLINLAP